MLFRIGTRGSKLALWQAHWVAEKLKNAGASVEIITIETKGDKIQNKALSKIGSKGVFTEELETALHNNTIDIAVHSAKDMPAVFHEDLRLIAFTEREQAHDVVVSYNQSFRLEKATARSLVGTSSTRRVATIKCHYPQIKTIDVRGNLQTRMKKLEEGACDGLILAYAGIKRMGYEAYICQHLSLDIFTPAVGQGTIAIQTIVNFPEDKQNILRETLNHTPTETCLIAERSFLKTLQGGCSIPVFGLATLENDIVTLQAGIISLDGKKQLKVKQEAQIQDAHVLGHNVAENLIEQGAGEILKDIRSKIGHEAIL